MLADLRSEEELRPSIESLDINGIPKLMPREVIMAMGLKSKNWLLDPEIMIKAHYMGVRILEFNIFARMRGNGISHVHAFRFSKAWKQDFKKAFRFSKAWKQDFKKAATMSETDVEAGDLTAAVANQ